MKSEKELVLICVELSLIAQQLREYSEYLKNISKDLEFRGKKK